MWFLTFRDPSTTAQRRYKGSYDPTRTRYWFYLLTHTEKDVVEPEAGGRFTRKYSLNGLPRKLINKRRCCNSMFALPIVSVRWLLQDHSPRGLQFKSSVIDRVHHSPQDEIISSDWTGHALNLRKSYQFSQQSLILLLLQQIHQIHRCANNCSIKQWPGCRLQSPSGFLQR